MEHVMFATDAKGAESVGRQDQFSCTYEHFWLELLLSEPFELYI